MKSQVILALAAFASLGLAAVPKSASAGEYAAMDCTELWVARNQIYKDNGYCFKTARAIDYFGNGGCSHYSAAALPLSGSDRTTLRRIKESWRGQHC